MASVNKAILVGHCGKDPEVRYMPEGKAVANISLATSETWKDKSGEKQEKVEWHRIVLFGKSAELAGEYLKKGSQVYFEGRIETKKYKDKDGVEKYSTQIIADRMLFLGGKTSPDIPDDAPQSAPAKNAPIDDSDIPFGSCDIADDVIWRKLRRLDANN